MVNYSFPSSGEGHITASSAGPRITSPGRAGPVLLGIGLGGFLDGIVLHQILQWHQMLSSVLPPSTMEAMHTNMFWDGIFHAAVWVSTLLGILVLWSGMRRSSTLPGTGWLIGWMLVGWGAFNLVEGTVNHHLLGLHHVRRWGPDPAWDLAFLASGPLLMGAGWVLSRRTSHSPPTGRSISR